MIGKSLGPYLIEEEIGRGGMGYVYRATQPSLGRTVAVKTLLPHLVADEEFIERFLREARATAKLSHPGIVTIHDVGEQDGTYYFAMEFLSGRTLDQIVRDEGRLSAESAVNYVSQLAAALGHAHSMGILHRDVKPSNVLVDRDNRAVLTDFGIAWAVSDSRLTRTGTAVGSPDYMSPEQVEGGAQDQRSDLYALGVLFYQLLVGETPYHGETPMAVAYQHVNGPIRSPRQVNPSVPAHIDAIVRKLLAKDPADRYGSAGELLAALGGQTPTGATTNPNAPTAAIAVSARRRSRVGLVAALLAVLGTGLAYGAYQYFGPAAAVRPAGGGAQPAAPAPASVDPSADPGPNGAQGAEVTPETAADGAESDDPGETTADLGDDPSNGNVAAVDPGSPGTATPEPETFLVTSRPAGAAVTLDGVRVEGVTPVEVGFLESESYQIGIELDGYESTGFEFTLETLDPAQRDSATLHFPLQSSVPPGVLVVASSYPLSVRVGNRTYDIADRREINLPPGSYEVVLEAPEFFLNETRQIEIASDGQVPVQVPGIVSVTIAATPSYCRVQVDGKDIGFVPATIDIAAGRHEFAFDWERLGKTRTVRRLVTPGTSRIFVSANDGQAQ